MKNENRYCVLGYPIGHSKSPEFQNLFLNITDYEANYEAVEMPPDELESSIDMLKNNYSGFNCTVPLKQLIIPYLDYISPVAKLCGSVNTVKVSDGKLYGYTTDGIGLIKALNIEGRTVDNKKILITGCGGVAHAIVFECVSHGADITIAARNSNSAQMLADSANTYINSEKVQVCELDDIYGHFDLLIQCTPVGMFPNTGRSIVNSDVIKNVDFVFDTIYNPPVTKIMEIADSLNIPSACGFNMLLLQGIASQEIWRDKKFADSEIQKLIDIYKNAYE